MPRFRTFHVTPALPDALSPLLELAYDLTWSWRPDARSLFRRIDPDLFREVNGNPVALLGRVGQERLDALASDDAFVGHLSDVCGAIEKRRAQKTWFDKNYADLAKTAGSEPLVAYFCAEYGLTEALPIYSGGLGVLAGDHCKTTHDLGIPFVAVGLAYQEGYFRQYLNADGWQQEDPYDNDFGALPMRRAKRSDGSLASVDVTIEGRRVEVLIWEVQIGRTRLFLLDTNSPANSADDRKITYHLYGGGREYRCKQEIVLGIGGFYALETLAITPTVYHMNEGHSAFMGLARIGKTMKDEGLSFAEARELCAGTNVFTTHTPVPAGFDIFDQGLVDRFLPDMHAQLGISREAFYRLGAHENDPNISQGFNMAYLALRCSAWVNGVSQLHAVVSRGMWKKLWPGFEPDEVPIVGVTNGIHTPTWTSGEMGSLLDRYLGDKWRREPGLEASWKKVSKIPDAELWRTHERAREQLVSFVRQRARRSAERLGRGADELRAADSLLDPAALTIGFARRFATYKRATLMLREPERLRALLANDKRPVQFVFAGKAHPQDQPAKEFIKQLVHFARDPAIKRRLVFLEEYDMGVARKLVSGVDVWLNNPRRPKEASGTSGMKLLANGGLNVSVLDGWWAEAYDGDNGWAIGNGELYADVDEGDAIEARILLDLLETGIVPDFYDRGADGLPTRWLRRVKASMTDLSWKFSTSRMVRDYTDGLYVPAARFGQELARNGNEAAKVLAARVERLEEGWHNVAVQEATLDVAHEVRAGAPVSVEALVALDGLEPTDVIVELVGGVSDGQQSLRDATVVELTSTAPVRGATRYSGSWTPSSTGQQGCTVRVRPRLLRDAPAREINVKFWE